MNKLVIISGPTAVGKTDISIKLAKRINGEIISADSVQVYKGMDIGSAKIKKSQMDGVVHHLIDIIEPSEKWSVSDFKKICDKAIAEIYSRGKIPIIAGGTGFYIQSVLYDIDFTKEQEDTTIRDELAEYYKTNGSKALFGLLKEVDPESAELIHENNIKRVIRAIEFYRQTGTKISSHNESERSKESPFDYYYFALTMDRKKLYDRIEKRVDIMLSEGLIDEVKGLKEKGYTKDFVSMQGLGYKEILDYLDGNISLDEAVYILKRDTRHFAKRQLTWFNREENVIFIDKDKYSDDTEIVNYMAGVINNE